jgi:drug/metabolite transporter (DMT)-like permease
LARKQAVYPLAVIGAVLIWSTSFTATKIALTSLPPRTIGALRFVLAAFTLGIILGVQKGFSIPSRGILVRLLASGLLGITLYFSLENLGVQLATASDAALIVASYPAITILLEIAFFGKKVLWLQLAGVCVAMLGVYFIVQGGPHDDAGAIRDLKRYAAALEAIRDSQIRNNHA